MSLGTLGAVIKMKSPITDRGKLFDVGALTENVNAMANSLTLQVRAIADVATAVTRGDLSREITVEAQGELDQLKNNLNQMIANLKTTTENNALPKIKLRRPRNRKK